MISYEEPLPPRSVRIDPSADVASSALIGTGSTVWHLAQVREDAQLGVDCVVGRGAYIGSGVRIGDRCKIQNHALSTNPQSSPTVYSSGRP